MAIMKLNSKMIYWKMYATEFDIDITSSMRSIVNSIKITKTVLPVRSKKKDSSPSKAEISVTSKNYIEDVFVEGMKIKIYMGYDRISSPLVFSGTIIKIPDGSAKEMLNYKIEAHSNEIELGYTQKNRLFTLPFKQAIISEIALENGLSPIISIKDEGPIKAQFMPMQRQKTDLQMLEELAKKWNCVCWFAPPNLMYFVDSEDAYLVGDVVSNSIMTYTLGYRTDKVPCNIESIEWKHKPAQGGSATNPGVAGFNEFGDKMGKNEYKIVALGKTWQLKPQYLKEAKENPLLFGKYASITAYASVSFGAVNTLKKYFEVVDYDENSRANVPPAGDNTGFELTINLNEGDPLLEPPRNALLYAGSINPKADTADLPNWIFRSGNEQKAPAKLKINEIELAYENGMLKNKLTCSMGW